jgi:hypothetical protein
MKYPKAKTIQPMFGSVLRGFRLGYGYSAKHNGFIRINAGGPPHRIDVAPVGGIPSKSGKGEHLCWWDEKDADAIVGMIKPLQDVTKTKKAASFYVDDDGQKV